MSVVQQDDIQQVWDKVKVWPQPLDCRWPRKFSSRLRPSRRGRRNRSPDLVGLWADMPPLSDEDVEQTIDEERMRKYG